MIIQKKRKLSFFYVIERKPAEILFKKKIDKIKDINQIYVTLSLYESIYKMNKKMTIARCHL